MNRLVKRLQQPLAARHIVLGMLRITTGKIPQKGMSIIRLDKGVGCSITRVIQVSAEVLKVPEAALERTKGHAADGQCLRERISFIDGPAQFRFIEPIVNCSMLKC